MDSLRKAEATVAAVLTIIAVWLHSIAARSAGGLWRDEANTVGLATLPTFGDVWSNLQYDSFPLLWIMLVRTFTGVFGPMNDVAFRAIGFAIGLLVIAVLWFNARTFGHRFPLVSLALFALSPSVVRWGDTLRAYGLGIALGLLTCGLLWRFVRAPGGRSLALVAISALLSVHTLYYNALVILALGAGAVVVFAMRRDWQNAIAVVAMGTIAAVSLIPYAATMIGAASWNSLVRIPDYNVAWFLMKLGETITPAGAWAVPVWSGAVILALWAVFRELTDRRRSMSSNVDSELAIFACVTLIVGAVVHFVFLRLLSYITQPWYYLTLLATIAACLEMMSGALIHANAARLIRLASVAAIALATIPYAIPLLRERLTNADLIASKLETVAVPGDIIVVSPWYTGVSFGRYYSGSATWTMLPAVGFHRFHRYDLLQLAMEETDQRLPARPVIEGAERALRAGHSVIVVGGLSGAGAAPSVMMQAARIPEDGWMSPRYQRQWAWMLEEFLRAHATRLSALPRDSTIAVSAYEDVPVAIARGWRD